jgi:hypothetical protein
MAAALGCMNRSVVAPPPSPSVESSLDDHGPAKLHLRDGTLVVLDHWRVSGTMIRGSGRDYGVERDLLTHGDLEVPLAAVVLVETNEQRVDPAIVPMLLVTAASIALTTYCLTANKACFGSCPTFYVPDGQGGWAIQAEGFSSSIARIFEADDVDDLPDARPRDGAITVAMRNEALETHMVRRVALLVAHGPPGSTVLRAFGDGYLAVGPSVAPEACATREGPDDAACTALASKDAHEVALESDGKDLAARTSITMRYPAPQKRDVALVLTARNSLMSTYVLYQMIAFQGRAYGDFEASMERGDPRTLAGLAVFALELGNIDVSFRQHGGPWRAAGSLGYIGPIARATRGLAFSVDDPAESVEVQLDFARAHWKLDAAHLAPVLASSLAPVEIAAEVTDAPGRDANAVSSSLQGIGPYLVTTPGDRIVLRFPLAPSPVGESTGYFLHSRGYYYEWMRDAWLRDEDLPRASIYLDDPARALRELAPAYRIVEPSMESVFRASRFAGSSR